MSGSDKLALADLIVTVVGFGVAIWQLVRTADASVATKEAVERTERRMAINHLLVLLPQFRIIESDLDNACEEDERRPARRALVAYSHIAGEVASVIEGTADADAVLVAKLRTSARTASAAKATLINDKTKLPKTATKDFRDELSDVMTYLTGLSTTLTLKAGI